MLSENLFNVGAYWTAMICKFSPLKLSRPHPEPGMGEFVISGIECNQEPARAEAPIFIFNF